MRVVVIGTSGAGKTAMATSIASALKLPCIELDRLHWEPNWEALSETNPNEFVRRVGAAISASDAWVTDGNYGMVRDLIWERATHLVWLDYGVQSLCIVSSNDRLGARSTERSFGPETEKTCAAGCDRATQSDGPGVRGENGA